MKAFKPDRPRLALPLLVLAALALAGCAPKPGATFTNAAPDPVTAVAFVTGESPSDSGHSVSPEETIHISLPAQGDLTLRALYSSGFTVNTLYTRHELEEGCLSTKNGLACRFTFTGPEIKLDTYSPAETFASTVSGILVGFVAIVAVVTLALFVQNNRKPKQPEP